MARTRWIGTSWAEADLLDVTILDSVLAGVQAHGGTWRRVVLQGCKIDSLNLRATRLHDVTFRDCDLTEVDFGSATLTGVTFPGSKIGRARFTKATVKKLDFRKARSLDVAEGWDFLRGPRPRPAPGGGARPRPDPGPPDPRPLTTPRCWGLRLATSKARTASA
jgi:hypothetical protein